MARRDGNDTQWLAVKAVVRKRDPDCRLVMKITPIEMLTLHRNAGASLLKLDPAHIFPVSTHPHLCYNSDNIVQLNRYSHDMLDSCRHPITGEFLTMEERNLWWMYIVGKSTYEKLQQMEKF